MTAVPIKVSIMIPTYNQGQFIGQAVESALAQTYPYLEVIVCDDASTDNTDQVLSAIQDPRLRYHRNADNLGRTANYRKLLYELASGDYVVNLDGDDYYTDPDFIKEAVKCALKSPNAVVISARAITKSPHSEALSPTPGDRVVSGKAVIKALPDQRYCFMHMSTVYRRLDALKLDFYRSNTSSSDWESLYRLCMHGQVAFLDRVVGVWRIHGGNETGTTDTSKHLSNLSIWPAIFTHASEQGFGKVRAAWCQAKCIAQFAETSIGRTSIEGNRNTLLFLVRLFHQYPTGALAAILNPKTLLIIFLAFTGHYRRESRPDPER
jgi:glycosyltransferase involved in cell wall biosynthesis